MNARAALAITLAVSLSCARGPRALVVGEDSCDYCRMTITDPRYGGQVVTSRGRVLTFDAVECLASYVAETPSSEIRSVHVSDYRTRAMVSAEEAAFVRGALNSPMGQGLAAFAAPDSSLPGLRAEFGGEVLRWKDVLAGARTAAADARHPDHSAEAHSEAARFSVDTIVVDPAAGSRPIADAVARAATGSVLILGQGTYREPVVTIDRPLTIDGRGVATLDGEGTHGLLVVAANDVTIRRLALRNTGHSGVEDRAAIRVRNVRRCVIEDNALNETMFGIYLEKSVGCVVRNNSLTGLHTSQSRSGNGIHLWYSDSNVVKGNHIHGHRDGIYFEFVKGGVVVDNESEANQRYGLHFMFSDDCQYEGNRFASNQSGVAVMYSKRVHIVDNRFEHNWGSAAYGLLLKEINDSEIRGNAFTENSVALHLEGSNRNAIEENSLERNGWAIRMMANAQENVVSGNRFEGNSFDVTTNSRQNFSTFSGNYWDKYRGYDLDHDGFGDVPYPPVRLFALVVEQSPATMILQHSILVDLLDIAERLLPSLTPETLVDAKPLMRDQKPEARGQRNVPSHESRFTIHDSRVPSPDND